MKYSTETVDTVRVSWDSYDNPPQIPNTFRQRDNVWVVPTQVDVSFVRGRDGAERAVRSAVVTGQQFQMYASGEVKKRGPGRGPVFEPTIWEWPTWNSMPRELRDVVRDAYYRVPAEGRS